MDNKLLLSALWYAKHGWAVFPLYSRGKTPLTEYGFKDATKDEAQIRRWWQQWPNANLGIATGDVSGFWVLDVDKDHDGFETLDALLKDYAPLPRTLETLTGSGGNHVLFAMPDWDLRNNAGTKLGKGLDIRGNGGYIVAPPSIHPNGQPYQWEPTSRPNDLPLAQAPGWLLEKLKDTGGGTPAIPGAPLTPLPTPSTPLPVSKNTLDFLANGAPIGSQHNRAVQAARNYLAAGYSAEDTIEKIWQAFQLCEEEPGKKPWTKQDADYLVRNLHETTPPPLKEYDGWASEKARYNQREVEFIVCAAAYLVPQMALVEMGWLKPEHFTYYKTKHFWQLFIESQDKDRAAHESGILPRLLPLMPGIEPHLLSEYARQLTTAGYMTAISKKTQRLQLALANADIDTARTLIKEMDGEAPTLNGREVGTVAGGLEKLDAMLDNPLNLLKTCIPPIDRAIFGLPLRWHSVWAARPGLGKTTLLWQIARNVANTKRKVAIFSLEMTEEDLWGKAVCGRLGLDWMEVLAHGISGQKKVEFRRTMDELKQELDGYLFIDDRPNTTDTLWQTITQYQPELVIVDHLRLLKDKDDNVVQRLGKITSRLKEIAKLGNCHVASIHQINRSVEARAQGDKEPKLSDLRDSGQIEEDVDLAFMLYRDNYYDKNAAPEPRVWTKLINVKNRFGKGVPPRINLAFDTRYEFYDEMREINLAEPKQYGSQNGHANGHAQRVTAPATLDELFEED